jgi:hypothetical protein
VSIMSDNGVTIEQIADLVGHKTTVAAWMRDLRRTDLQAAEKVEAAVDVLAEYGPTLGRPLVDTLTGSKLANLKESRPRQANIRVLSVFDPWRSAIPTPRT